MIPAMCAVSTRCLSTFWPYDVRYRSRPSSVDQLRVHLGDADLDQRVLGGPLAEPLDLVLGRS